MSTQTAWTEAVIRKHLNTFLEGKGVDAIVADYAEDASLYTEARVYQGTGQIREFFSDFIAALPPGAVERFTLKSLRVDGNLGFITWAAGREIPLGTDTFLVRDGRIVSQTFAMSAA
jgi:ketosteroid isomerase-like protein